MDGITIGLIIVIIFIIIAFEPFGKRANSIIVGSLTALASVILWQSGNKPKAIVVADAVETREETHGGAVSASGAKAALRVILRNAKNALVSGTAGIAAIGSFGFGGDTIVEVLALALEAGAYVGELAMIFLEDTSDFSATMSKIWAIDFKGGVDGVKSAMTQIYESAGDSVLAMLAYVKGIFKSTIDWLLGLFGRVLSAIIPDDAGVVGWILSESMIGAIRIASNNLFWIFNSAYNHAVPDAVHVILQNPERMKDAIINVIKMINDYLVGNDDDSWAKKAMQYAGRQTAVSVVTGTTIMLGMSVLPIVFIPLAAVIAISGSIMNVAATAGIGTAQMRDILTALYTREFTVPGVGMMTAVDALVMLIDKVIPLTFAGMFILSDYSSVISQETTTVKVDIEEDMLKDLPPVAPKLETTITATEGSEATDLGSLPDKYVKEYNEKMKDGVSLDQVLSGVA